MIRIRPLVDAVLPKLPAISLYISSTGMLAVGIAAQSIGFIVLARWLGSEQFGRLAMITAVTNLGAAWCGIGASEAMRRRVGRDPDLYPTLLGHSLILISLSGFVLTAILSIGMTFFIEAAPNPSSNYWTILLLVLSNVVMFAWIGLTEQIFLVRSEFLRANILNSGAGVVRAATALVACVGFDIDSLSAWAVWNFAASAALSLICVAAIWSYAAPRWHLLLAEIPLGASLSMSFLVAALRQNVDLLALGTIASPHFIGVYGVARRIISMAIVTGASLDRLLYASFATAGKAGPSATFRLAQRYVFYAIGITGITSLTIFVFAPLLPWCFGNDFSDAVWILRVLCWTLILTAVQFIAFDALTAADQHRARFVVGTTVGVLGAAVIVGLSFAFGVTGTVVAVYLTELSMVVALWSVLKMLSDRQIQLSPQPIPAE